MNRCIRQLLYITFFTLQLVDCVCQAEIKVASGHSAVDAGFAFQNVPAPVTNDAATAAKFTVVDGTGDPNGGQLAVLHDGQMPSDQDEPAANFFFRAGSDGGRIRIDLGRVVPVKQIGTYSWHTSSRAPQVYTLYATDGTAAGIELGPKRGTEPETCGWKKIARVDTRLKDGDDAGQHGVAITDSTGLVGEYRYLLFDVMRTEERDSFGNTFFSEIDVLDAKGPAPIAVATKKLEPILKSFEAENGKFRFTIDATAAPDLVGWSESQLRPVVQTWYPKIVALLPSEGYEAPTSITLRFRTDMAGGIPAYATGRGIHLNAPWFRRELSGEAAGCVVHELVHVVQNYGRARRNNPTPVSTPGWVVEGIADYIRWFLYEPQSKGAEITKRNLARANYDSSYRITGNFLDWVTQNHDKDLVRKLNVAAREGKYNEQLWKEWTGKTLQELGAEWKKYHEERLAK